MADIKVSEYILTRLKELSCHHVYGVPAASASGFFTTIDGYHGVPAFDGVKVVNTSSELEAGYAADGYGRANGFGATAVSYGVGTQCFVNAVSAALVERVPMMVINGGPTQDEMNFEADSGVLFTHSTGRLHSDLKILAKVTLAARRLDPSPAIGHEIDRLFVQAISELGPVYLELGNDVFDYRIPEPAESLQSLIPEPDASGLDAFVEEALRRLANAKCPVFLVGVELVRNRELPALLQRVLDRWRPMRYYTTVLGKSVLPEESCAFGGTFDSDLAPTAIVDALYQSDCVICLGCVFGVTFKNLVKKRSAYMIRAGFNQGRVENDIFDGVPLKGFLEALGTAGARGEVKARPAAAEPLPYAASYLDRRFHWVQQGPTDSRYLTHDEIFQVLDDFLRAYPSTPYTMMVDTCLGSYPGADLTMKGQHNYLADPVWMSIGWAAAACIGVYQGSRPRKRPVVVVGDGGFQTIAQCVSTIARYKVPVIMIIIDNALYAIEQFVLDPCFFLDASSQPYKFVNLNRWDYEAMGQLFGIERGGTFKADNKKDLQCLIQRAHEDPAGTYIIAARVATHDLPPENEVYAQRKCTLPLT